MIGGIVTMAWKEWKELFAPQGVRRGGTVNFLVIVAVFGVVMPLQFGRAWVESPTMLLTWTWIPLLLLSNMVVDAIAGERERHTLETLLATPLSDRAILLGKIAAAVAYGLAVTVASLAVGLVAVNVFTTHERLLLYPPATLVAAAITSVVAATLVAGLGVLVSLRAATVRQAGQIMNLAVLAIAFGPVLVMRLIARSWPSVVPTPQNIAILAVAGVVAFVALDVAIVIAALLRFQRSRLLVVD
jgi:ABC-2 type transport system permease protein